MIEQIQEIGAIISPIIFGKSYMQLRHECTNGKLAASELFECTKIAGEIRLEALKQVRLAGRDPTRVPMDDFLRVCEIVIEQPQAIERQKAELKRRGFLKEAEVSE